MAANHRRGIAELLAALIVAVALTSAALIVFESLHRGVELASSAAESVSERIAEASDPPVLSVEYKSGSLYLVVYPHSPVNIKYLVYLKNGRVHVEELDKTITNVTEILVDPSYDCSPASIDLVTSSGVVIPYSPAKDPLVLSAAYSGKWGLLEKNRIDCELLDAVENQSEEAQSPATPRWGYVSNSGDWFRVIDAGPATTSLERGDPYSIVVLGVDIAGNISGSFADLKFNLTLENTGERLGSASLHLNIYNGQFKALAYLGTVKGDQDQDVRVYAAAACSPASYNVRACVAGILFDAGEPTIYSGEAYINMTASFTSYTGCPLGPAKYTAPAILGQVSLYNLSVKGSCRITEWYTLVRIEVNRLHGIYTTSGPLILMYSTGEAYNVRLRAEVWLRETDVVSGSSSSIELPCRGPIEYSLVPYEVSPAGPLEDAIMTLYSYKRPYPTLLVSYNGTVLERAITPSTGVIPLRGVSYEMVIPPYKVIPFSTGLSISYSKRVVEKGQSYEVDSFTWNITAHYEPQPYMQPIPYVVKVTCMDEGEKLLVVAPPTGPLTLRQASNSFMGLATLLAGYPASAEPTNDSSLYLLRLGGEPSSRLTASFNMSGSPQALPREFVVSEPGTYLVVGVPSRPSSDPSTYEACLVRAY